MHAHTEHTHTHARTHTRTHAHTHAHTHTCICSSANMPSDSLDEYSTLQYNFSILLEQFTGQQWKTAQWLRQRFMSNNSATSRWGTLRHRADLRLAVCVTVPSDSAAEWREDDQRAAHGPAPEPAAVLPQ